MPGFGYTAGFNENQLNLQDIQMNGLKIQDARIGLVRDKIALAQQMKLLQLMQGLHPGASGNDPDQMAGLMDQMSMIQLQAGMPDAAAKSMQVASQVRSTASQVDYRQYRLQAARLTQFANILGSVPDTPQGFQDALRAMRTADPRASQDPRFQKLARTQWRPGLISSIKSSVLSAKDKAEIAYRRAAEDHAEASAAADQDRLALIRAQTKYYQDRDKSLSKVGRAPLKAGQLSVITDMATRDFPGADPADIRVRSRPLAEQMVRMMQTDHLTESEAAVRIYQKAKMDGTFNGMRMAPSRKGASPRNPIALPDSADKIIQNQWYMVDGQPRLALGDKFFTQEELAEMESEDDALTDDEDADEEAEDNAPAVEK